MADGKTHAAAGKAALWIVAPVSAGLCIAHPACIGLLAGAALGFLLTPDIDHIYTTVEERRIIRYSPVLGTLWQLYWAPYRAMRPHRGVSHTWPRGTAERFLYALWPALVASLWWPGFEVWLFWWLVFCGQSVQDIVHLILDGE